MVVPPSKRIKMVLSGEVRMDDEHPSIQSACRLHIYHGAEAVLSLPTKEARRAALSKIPESVRPYVEREAIRLHKLRNSLT